MTLRLNGSTSGYVEIDAPATAGSNTLVLPTGNGTNGQYLQTNGSGGLSWATVTDTTGWTWDTTGTSLNGNSSVLITGIPSTAKKVIVAINALSGSADADWSIQLGTSSGLQTSSYYNGGGYVGAATGGAQSTTSFSTTGLGSHTYINYGQFVLTNIGGNTWHGHLFDSVTGNGIYYFMNGAVTLSGTLQRFQLATNSGSFDGGTIYVHYFSP